MATLHSWEVSDSFWAKVEPLIPLPKRDPNKTYKRKPGAGRKPIAPRRVFEAIVYVLRTGCQWKALPKETYHAAPVPSMPISCAGPKRGSSCLCGEPG